VTRLLLAAVLLGVTGTGLVAYQLKEEVAYGPEKAPVSACAPFRDAIDDETSSCLAGGGTWLQGPSGSFCAPSLGTTPRIAWRKP
jgi:hypothetical protein